MPVSYLLKEPILVLENLTAGYDGNVVLKDINIVEHDLFIEGRTEGQIICFVSQSGRGKSTLFKVLSGLMEPMSGRELFRKHHDPNEPFEEIHEGEISLIDQKYTLFRHKTVFEILMYSLRKDKTRTKKEKETFIDEVLSSWGIMGQKNQYPCQLSGGQKQRVCILSKALTGKQFLIMDEPISGLDVASVDRVKQLMKTFKSMGELNTLMFSTHDLSFAVEMSDVVYVLGRKNPEDTFSTIVERFDLRELKLPWKDFCDDHLSVMKKIKESIINS